MRAKKLTRRYLSSSHGGLDISSLIDVCFLLLIYFIVATTIQGSEQNLETDTPGSGKSSVDVAQPFFIKVDQSGAIYVGAGDLATLTDTDTIDRKVPLLTAQLKSYTTGMSLSTSIPMVQIKIHPEAKQQRVMDILNAVSKQKIKHVAFVDVD